MMATDRIQGNEAMANRQDQARASVEQVGAPARQAIRESFAAVEQASQQAAFTTERLSQQGGQVAATAFGTA